VKSKKSKKRGVAKAALLVAISSLAALAVGYAAVYSSERRTERNSVVPVETSTARPLSFASASPEDLARNVIAAIAADDRRALGAARITEDEFRNYVWPELPASRVPNVTVEFAWSQASLNNHAGFERVLQNHKGRIYEFVSIRFLGGVTSYKTFKVHNKALLTVRDETGTIREARIFGSMLELDGQYKLFSYVAD
jgi:hypothetical protein